MYRDRSWDKNLTAAPHRHAIPRSFKKPIADFQFSKNDGSVSWGERFDVKIADIANRVLSINIRALLFTEIVFEENSRENRPIRPIKKEKKKEKTLQI